MRRSRGFVLRESGFLSVHAGILDKAVVEPMRSILGDGTSTSQSGLPNRFKIDTHHLGEYEVSAPSDNVEAQGREIERSSGLG